MFRWVDLKVEVFGWAGLKVVVFGRGNLKWPNGRT